MNAEANQAVFRLQNQDASFVEYAYTLPANSYKVELTIKTTGMEKHTSNPQKIELQLGNSFKTERKRLS
jgi:hypothetical protein